MMLARHATTLKVYGALLVLLALTMVLSGVTHGGVSLATGLLIASAKALLIILFFMEVRHSIPAIRLALLVTLVWGAIFAVLGFADYFSRSWPVNPFVASAPWKPGMQSERSE